MAPTTAAADLSTLWAQVRQKKTAMPDDTSKTGADRKLISLQEDYEVRDWAMSLGCTEDELRAAVKAVGNSADKVRSTCGGTDGHTSEIMTDRNCHFCHVAEWVCADHPDRPSGLLEIEGGCKCGADGVSPMSAILKTTSIMNL